MVDTRFLITKLNNSNYQTWKYKVELLLTKEELWNVVKEERPEQPDEKWKKADSQAKATIGLLLEDDQLRHIRDTISAKLAWEALKRYHEKASLTNVVHLLKKMCNMRMAENGDMESHINNMLNIVDKLTALGEVLKESLVISLLLSSLPDSFSTLITALETRTQDELTLELVKGKLIDEASRRKNSRFNIHEDTEQALKISHKQPCYSKDFKGKNSGTKSCYFCNKLGHMKKDCFKYKKWLEKNQSQKASQVTTNERDKHTDKYRADQYCFDVQVENSHKDTWYMDSGATCHMSNDVKFFRKIRMCDDEHVRLADGTKIRVQGIGEVNIVCSDDTGQHKLLIKDVLYIPSLKENLISVKRLTDKDFVINFNKKGCSILRNNKVVAQAHVQNNMFALKDTHRALAIVQQHSDNCQHTWHRKLGHRNMESIKDMISKGHIKGIKIQDCGIRQVCETCVKGKMTRKPFPQKSSHQSKSILELIHSDVCGPMQTVTPSGKRYILTLIDDYSRFTFIYLLNNKSEVSGKIKDFIQLMKVKFNKVPKVFRSDRGKEYLNNELKELFCKEGIEAQYTAGYTPEQNGVAERKNRSLLEMTRCLLIDAQLPYKYWGEAVLYANYLQNRLCTKATGITPIKRWYNVDTCLKDMHLFGSCVYAHVPKELRKKLDVKAKEFRFMGHDANSKGYRLLDTETNRILISRDVKFVNNTYYNNKNQKECEPETNYKELQGKEETDKGRALIDLCKRSTNDDNMRTNIDFENDDTQNSCEEESEASETDEDVTTKRGRGRPRIIRTGLRGRPKKEYHTTQENRENHSTAYATEVLVNDAISSKNADEWLMAMVQEIKSMLEKDVWEIVERPTSENVIDSRMVLTNKYGPNGDIDKRKARLVARGFSQMPGRDFHETFAPVARLESIRLAAAVAAHYGMHIHQVDVTTAYLHGSLDETIYMEAPEHFKEILDKLIRIENKDGSIKSKARKMLKQVRSGNKVFQLKKAIYGLKQAGRQWHGALDKQLKSLGVSPSNVDPCIYYSGQGKELVLIVIYVDDILIISKDLSKIRYFKEGLSKAFTIKDLGIVKYCLGVEFSVTPEGIKLSQKGYVKELLKKFNMCDAKSVKVPMDPGLKLTKENSSRAGSYPYRELIGGLMYLAVTTRPDISHAVSALSQFNNCYGEIHWEAAKRILKYLKGTNDYCLTYHSGHSFLKGFTDADWGGCVDDRHSYTGYVFFFGGGPVAWESRKQKTVALSTTEAEYVAITDALKEATYLINALSELGIQIEPSITIFNDNASALKLAKNPIYHVRTKHIAIRHHYIKDVLQEGKIELQYLRSEDMVSDILTKALSGPKHKKHTKELELF